MEVKFPCHPRARKSGITPNGPKVREAILHVIREADSRDLRVSQFDILKTLFLSDRAHLNKYGRPITFDEYVAMPDGPVPSLAYDILKGAIEAWREAGISQPLWQASPDGGKKMRFSNALRDGSDEVLSETDIQEITAALLTVKGWGYKRTWDHVHGDVAYNDAWSKRPDGTFQYPMNLALMMDEPDDDYADQLKFASAHL